MQRIEELEFTIDDLENKNLILREERERDGMIIEYVCCDAGTWLRRLDFLRRKEGDGKLLCPPGARLWGCRPRPPRAWLWPVPTYRPTRGTPDFALTFIQDNVSNTDDNVSNTDQGSC